jgi:probable F420-dependent oxidoreductase
MARVYNARTEGELGSAGVEFILGYPEKGGVDGDLLDSGPVGDLAAAGERAGWGGFALTEHPAPGAKWLAHGGHQTLDPFVGLAFAAAVTERMRLLTYLAVAPYRNPLLTAKAATTLDRLSGGRFVLGVGTGYHKAEFFALGVDFDERNDLFDEMLDVLPLAWSGEPFSFQGRHFDARDVIVKPAPGRRIPVWIGGNSKLTRRRVAQRAQGWMPFMVSGEVARTTRTPALDSVAVLRDQIADLRAQAGDRAGEIEIALAYDDPAIHRPTEDVERHRAAFAELAEAGVDWIAVTARPGAPSELLEFAQAFGETYIT